MPTPPEDDPFLILGLDPAFEIESGDLNRAYLTRVATLHPDAAGTDADAARINDARRILEDLESRANALLRHLGGPVKEDHRELPPGFLTEILEAREHMESIIDTDDSEALTAFAALAEDRRKHHVDRVAGLFQDLSEPPTPEALTQIRVELNAWRYAERMIEQLQPEARSS